jgi:hypothetical protein
MTSAAFPPLVELTLLYEKTSARGTRYMVGRLGHARITLLPGVAAEDGTATWRMLLREASKSRGSVDRPRNSSASHPRRGRPSSPSFAPPKRLAPVVDLPADRLDDIFAEPTP